MSLKYLKVTRHAIILLHEIKSGPIHFALHLHAYMLAGLQL